MIHKWNHKHWVKVGFQLGDLPYHTKSVTTIFMPFRGFHESIISMPFRSFHKTTIFMPFWGCSQTFSKHTTINYSILENPYFIKHSFHTIIFPITPKQSMNEYGIQWSPYSKVLNYISSPTNPFTQGLLFPPKGE